MAFTSCTVTHAFQAADGTAASGTITFRLSKRMTNGTTSVMPTEITATLSGGALSQTLTANNDPATIPVDAQYECTIRIGSAQLVGPYSITVPTGGGTVDLATLLPQDQQGG